MKVVVANLTAGGLSGGYRKYLVRLMPLLAVDPRLTRLTVFVPGPVDIDPSVDVRSWEPRDAQRGHAALARDIAALRPDVVFVPTARRADFASVPVVTMVRNMEPLMVPFGGNTVREGLKNVARAWEAQRACRAATRIVAVSSHVRDFIVSRWHVDPARVGLAYHGVDPPEDTPTPAGGPPTLFTAGSIRPARGLEDAIRALPLLGREVRLEIAGRIDPGCERYAAGLRRLVADLGVAGRVTWAGHLDSEAMSRMFRTASVFIMTSRAEACPNTALEAMSYGCAIVSVDHAPMPEFFLDTARYYTAGDPRALARNVEAIVDDGAERDRLGRAARCRARAFTWEATRDCTIAELERAVA
jgi:glycosyltransferase involved in cell wall biosynthesis